MVAKTLFVDLIEPRDFLEVLTVAMRIFLGVLAHEGDVLTSV